MIKILANSNGQVYITQNNKVLKFNTRKKYTELEYLTSCGQQWIDTGYIPNDTTGLKICWSRTDNVDRAVIGSRHTDKGDTRIVIGVDENSMYLSWNSLYRTNIVTQINTFYETSINFYNSRKRYLDEVELDEITETLSTQNQSIALFWIKGAVNKATCKIKYAQITEGDNLIFHLIPVLDENGVACMYDKVSDRFFYNQGTGQFVHNLKPYAQELEYLKANGAQWVDTELNYFADVEVGVKLDSNVMNKLLGNYGSNCIERISSTNPYWLFNSSPRQYSSTALITEYHALKWKDGKIYVDGNQEAELIKQPLTNRMYLFGIATNEYFPATIYFCKLWNPSTGELVRDYIPVLDGNNVPCFYDKVTELFFYNKGTGEFLYG